MSESAESRKIENISFAAIAIIQVIVIIVILLQVNALLVKSELKQSAQCKGHFPLYNCLVLGQVQQCAAGLLQPVPCETALQQPQTRPHYDSAGRPGNDS